MVIRARHKATMMMTTIREMVSSTTCVNCTQNFGVMDGEYMHFMLAWGVTGDCIFVTAWTDGVWCY